MKRTEIMKEKIYIRSAHRGFIPPLRMSGPIVSPLRITRETAYAIIVSGIEIFEVDPVTKKLTRLTAQNVFPREKEKVGSPSPEKAEQKQTVKVTSEPIKPIALEGIKKDIPKEIKSVTDEEKPENKQIEKEENINKTLSGEEPENMDKNKTQPQQHNNGKNKNKK